MANIVPYKQQTSSRVGELRVGQMPVRPGANPLAGMAETLEKIRQQEARSEIREANKRLAAIRAEATVELAKRAAEEPLDSKTFVQGIQGYVDGFRSRGEDFATPEARQAWDQGFSIFASQFYAQAGVSQVERTGKKAVLDYTDMLSSWTATLTNAPSQLEPIMTEAMRQLDDPNGAYSAMPAAARAEMKIQVEETLGEAAVLGSINDNPWQAKKALEAGQFNDLLGEGRLPVMLNAADTEIRSRREEARRVRLMASQEKAAAAAQANLEFTEQYIKDPTSVTITQISDSSMNAQAKLFWRDRLLADADNGLGPDDAAVSSAITGMLNGVQYTQKQLNELGISDSEEGAKLKIWLLDQQKKINKSDDTGPKDDEALLLRLGVQIDAGEITTSKQLYRYLDKGLNTLSGFERLTNRLAVKPQENPTELLDIQQMINSKEITRVSQLDAYTRSSQNPEGPIINVGTLRGFQEQLTKVTDPIEQRQENAIKQLLASGEDIIMIQNIRTGQKSALAVERAWQFQLDANRIIAEWKRDGRKGFDALIARDGPIFSRAKQLQLTPKEQVQELFKIFSDFSDAPAPEVQGNKQSRSGIPLPAGFPPEIGRDVVDYQYSESTKQGFYIVKRDGKSIYYSPSGEKVGER